MCPAAKHRLVVSKVPATLERSLPGSTSKDKSTTKNRVDTASHHANTSYHVSPKHVAEITQQFITLMDALKLNMIAVDHIHPLLADLARSLTLTLSTQSTQVALDDDLSFATNKVREWCVLLLLNSRC